MDKIAKEDIISKKSFTDWNKLQKSIDDFYNDESHSIVGISHTAYREDYNPYISENEKKKVEPDASGKYKYWLIFYYDRGEKRNESN